MKIRLFDTADEAQVVALWEACGLRRSWNVPHLEIARKRAVDDDLFLVAEKGGVVVGTLMAGYDGHRGSINYVGVLPDSRKMGIGRALMSEAERRLLERGAQRSIFRSAPKIPKRSSSTGASDTRSSMLSTWESA